jgi:hypothetical protein
MAWLGLAGVPSRNILQPVMRQKAPRPYSVNTTYRIGPASPNAMPTVQKNPSLLKTHSSFRVLQCHFGDMVPASAAEAMSITISAAETESALPGVRMGTNERGTTQLALAALFFRCGSHKLKAMASKRFST